MCCDPPAGLVVATLDAGGVGLRAGPIPYLVEGGVTEVAVLLDSRLGEAARVEVGGSAVRVGAGGVELAVRTVTGAGPDGIDVMVRAEAGTGGPLVGRARAPGAEPAARARLRPRAAGPSRWSVVDDRGGAWFPTGGRPSGTSTTGPSSTATTWSWRSRRCRSP
jgi:hypothetical protein